ncbi:MAG: TatD family hydrolase [Tissierellia bacterium]|nr:TatD family hydrolase [Tissierellia bacterium]
MIDSHAHLDEKRYNKDRDKIIKNFKKDGLDLVFNIGADLETSRASLDLAKKHDRIYAVIGVHPHDAETYTMEVEEELRQMAQEDKVVAIGEVGLDFYRDLSPRDVQRVAFNLQIDLAHDLGLPLVIHSRDADQETFDILKLKQQQYGDLKILIHCYSGSVEMMERYTKELGALIALGGSTTFKNSRVPKEVAKAVPLDYLLLETDSPYLTPEPFRGKRNEPKNVRLVAEFIADLRGMDVKDLIKITDQNTLDFFGVHL